jgi:group I intron endonuclease
MNTNIDIVPVRSYFNSQKCKFIIYKDNRKKSGVYQWTNLINGKIYIGSSISLSRRFYNYYSLSFLEKKVSKNSSTISNALLKYGHSNFSLDILEYCDSYKLLIREQYYIDKLLPEYNICKTVGLTLGFKYSKITKKRKGCYRQSKLFAKQYLLKI